MSDNYIRRADFVQQFIDNALNICPFCGSDSPYWTIKDSFEYPERRFYFRCCKCGGTLSAEELNLSSHQRYLRVEQTGEKNVPLLFQGHELKLETLRETAISVITRPKPVPDLSFKPRTHDSDKESATSIAFPLVFAIIAAVILNIIQYNFWEQILNSRSAEVLFKDGRFISFGYMTRLVHHLIEAAAYGLIIIEIILHGRGKHTVRGIGPVLLTVTTVISYSQFENMTYPDKDTQGFFAFLYVIILIAVTAMCFTYVIRTDYFKKGVKTAACITVIVCIIFITLPIITSEDMVASCDTLAEFWEYAGPYINSALSKICIFIALMAYTPGKVDESY